MPDEQVINYGVHRVVFVVISSRILRDKNYLGRQRLLMLALRVYLLISLLSHVGKPARHGWLLHHLLFLQLKYFQIAIGEDLSAIITWASRSFQISRP